MKKKEQSEGIAETSSRRDRKRMQFFYTKKCSAIDRWVEGHLQGFPVRGSHFLNDKGGKVTCESAGLGVRYGV